MSAIFLSYRRDDTAGYSGRLFADLVERFGRERVFMDIETLEPGLDFVEGIDRAIASCGALIALIGPNWLGQKDSEGRRRLDDPDDFIRLEICSALERGVRVIPVLVHNARMPLEVELPEPLRPLCRLQAFEISDNRWEFDVGRLAKVLDPLVGGSAAGGNPLAEGEAGDRASTPRGSPAGAETGPGSGPTRMVAAVALVLAAALAGGGWWLSRQAVDGPQAPTPVNQPQPRSDDALSPADRAGVTMPKPPAKPAPDPADASAAPAPAPAPAPHAEPLTDPAPQEGPSAEELAAQQKARTITALLARAKSDLAELRLTLPAGDNAYERYREVLELDPDNRDAHEGLRAIAERYRGLVEQALARAAFDDAERYLESARTVDSGSDWLGPMEDEIQRQRRRAERAPAPAPSVAPDAPRDRGADLQACLADCEREHRACRSGPDASADANCLRDRMADCEARYQACMSDAGALVIWGRASLSSQCAGDHSRCERAAEEACANASPAAGASCDRRLEQCNRACRDAR